jgi:hypothetical protein
MMTGGGPDYNDPPRSLLRPASLPVDIVVIEEEEGRRQDESSSLSSGISTSTVVVVAGTALSTKTLPLVDGPTRRPHCRHSAGFVVIWF